MKGINYNKKFEIDPELLEKTPKQVLGDEMMLFFPEKDTVRIWVIVAKHKKPFLERAFRICQDKGINNLNYLQGILRNSK